jgi:hypothetical protein
LNQYKRLIKEEFYEFKHQKPDGGFGGCKIEMTDVLLHYEPAGDSHMDALA